LVVVEKERGTALKAAWRTVPSAVHPENSISATNSGRAQCTFAVLRGAPLPVKGDLSDINA
jgi:hypothetical protein